VLIDASHHRHYVTRKVRNPRCRFDHEIWDLANLDARPTDLTLGEALGLQATGTEGNGASTLCVDGRAFVTAVSCVGCGQRRRTLRLQGRLRKSERVCSRCGAEMIPVGFEVLERLSANSVPNRVLRRSLGSLGFKAGDIYSVNAARGERRHHEIEGDRL
jgi:hypothetical protein